MSAKKKKRIPEFQNEDAEREFWSTHDSADFIDWEKSRQISFPALKPTLKSISIRLPESMIAQLKVEANKRDVPYQSLVKMYLAEKLREEAKRQAQRD